VVDSRPRFATPERFPDTDKLIVGIPSEIVKTLPMSSVTAVILVAHDYKYDLPILRHVLSSPAGYIGVLGSRRRGEGLLKFLQEEGMAEEELQRIRVPIGLDLGGQTAPEIALAILAEVVSSRYGASHLPLSQQRSEQRKRAEEGLPAMTLPYNATIFEHFRHPRNYGALPLPDVAYEDVNSLCGDRIRMELKIGADQIIAHEDTAGRWRWGRLQTPFRTPSPWRSL
jgi:hypothetical protein